MLLMCVYLHTHQPGSFLLIIFVFVFPPPRRTTEATSFAAVNGVFAAFSFPPPVTFDLGTCSRQVPTLHPAGQGFTLPPCFLVKDKSSSWIAMSCIITTKQPTDQMLNAPGTNARSHRLQISSTTTTDCNLSTLAA
ncbi:hypothetical protein F5884DRAFT_85415 [Xylogone sp. PMI_703]|nr:hypothetical protein F5884DRAFT_85415 [Xylogone sp. PMI_703]